MASKKLTREWEPPNIYAINRAAKPLRKIWTNLPIWVLYPLDLGKSRRDVPIARFDYAQEALAYEYLGVGKRIYPDPESAQADARELHDAHALGPFAVVRVLPQDCSCLHVLTVSPVLDAAKWLDQSQSDYDDPRQVEPGAVAFRSMRKARASAAVWLADNGRDFRYGVLTVVLER